MFNGPGSICAVLADALCLIVIGVTMYAIAAFTWAVLG